MNILFQYLHIPYSIFIPNVQLSGFNTNIRMAESAARIFALRLKLVIEYLLKNTVKNKKKLKYDIRIL